MNRAIPAIALVGALTIPCAAVNAQRALTPEDSAARREALQRLNPERVVARSTTGGVILTARCGDGYVSGKTFRPSATTVRIVSEQLVSCSGNQCRALQVVARSEDGAPFDFEMVVTCAS